MDTTSDEAASKNKEDVRQNTTQHTRLNNSNLSILQCDDTDLIQCQPCKRKRIRILTINSTAFPKVAFNRPPIVCPNFTEISSVANDNTAASGTIARKFSTKTTVGFQCNIPAMMPNGTNTSKTLT